MKLNKEQNDSLIHS